MCWQLVPTFAVGQTPYMNGTVVGTIERGDLLPVG
jgi:hypothetical protein